MKKGRVYIGLLLILIGATLVLLYAISSYNTEKVSKQGIDIFDDIIIKEDEEHVYIEDGLIDELKEVFKNKDIIGYVVYKEANISYPIVKSKDNKEYLSLDIYGNYSISGSIFMDCLNKGDFSDISTVLYGHNMLNGSMFGDLEEHVKENNMQKDEYVYVYTRDSKIKYKCVAFEYIEPSKENAAILISRNQESFSTWLKSVSGYETVNTGDCRFLTLVTCSYNSTRFGLTCIYDSSKTYKYKED